MVLHAPPRRRAPAVWTLVVLLAFLGTGAIGGGASFLVDTSGRTAGLTTELLARTPFSSFLWPGVLLTVGFGVPSVVTAYGIARRPRLRVAEGLERATDHHWAWGLTLGLGVALIVWITVQVLLIERSWLQPLMGCVGVAIVLLALSTPVRDHLRVVVPVRGDGDDAHR